MPVQGIGFSRSSECRDRSISLAQLFADLSERKPGGGKIGRKLERLEQEIGGSGEIAFQLQIAREIKPTVGNQIT